jgi:hypothetical protein
VLITSVESINFHNLLFIRVLIIIVITSMKLGAIHLSWMSSKLNWNLNVIWLKHSFLGAPCLHSEWSFWVLIITQQWNGSWSWRLHSGKFRRWFVDFNTRNYKSSEITNTLTTTAGRTCMPNFSQLINRVAVGWWYVPPCLASLLR